MTLLSSSAQHVYWLGRYLFRIGYVAEQLPFVDDQKAEVFAQGLCLHIEDAENLNQFMLDEKQPYSLINQLEIARNNIQELRALFSATAYAELNTLIKNATNTPDMILELVQDCREILKNEKNLLIIWLKSFNFIPDVILAAQLKIFDGIFLNSIESYLIFFLAQEYNHQFFLFHFLA